MNAKKIMGAVLVALLAAALFTGAVAAEEKGLGTVFLYQTGAPADGTFTLGDSTVTVIGKEVSTTDLSKFVDGGKYSNGTAYYIVKLPNAIITATAGDVNVLANGIVADKEITITATPEIDNGIFKVAGLVVYDPQGVPHAVPLTSGSGTYKPTEKGEYQIQAILDGTKGFVGTIDGNLLYGKKYAFNVYSTEPTLTVSADSVIINNYITATITGVPGNTYTLKAPGFEIPEENQIIDVTGKVATIDDGEKVDVTLSNTGKAVIYLKAENDDGKKTLVLNDANGKKLASAVVKIVKGTITAVADEDSYFVGNPVGLSGTTTAGSSLFFYIEGTNFAFTQLLGDDISEALDVENGEWTVELDSSEIKSVEGKKLIAGTYTVVVATKNATKYEEVTAGVQYKDAAAMKEDVMDGVYGTAAITLTQPFLTGIEAADTAIQESEYKITGTAYSADEVRIYIFGTNYFFAKEVDTDEEVFEIELSGDQTKAMAPGTYFYLIQHPMSDKLFNVWNGTSSENCVGRTSAGNPAEEADFYYAPTVASGSITPAFIFNAWERGTNYAAQALLEAIAGQDIDDIFVQGTFEVAAQKLTINPIPAEVAKGTKLAITGSSNSGEGVEVIVNVLAGKFGATVKGDENSATFLTAKAVTEEDGTFEAAIDTSKLEVGSYIVTVEIAGTMYDSAAVEIVDKAPETPVDPVDPVDPKPVDPQPTEPETPGFGALAALAGLGAVAVLLLRRE